MKSLGNIKGFVCNLIGLSDDTEPLRKRYKCNRVHDDFSSDEEMPNLKSKWAKTNKHHLLNKEKRKPVKTSSINKSNVLQLLSDKKELTVTETPTTGQPVLDADMAGCSRNININISITPAEVIRASEELDKTYKIDSDDEIENISDSEMIKESSTNQAQGNNDSSQMESFDDWLKKLNAQHKAYMENTRKSINDILQKYASVSKVCADNLLTHTDNKTLSRSSSSSEDLLSEFNANYKTADELSTSNNISIDADPIRENEENLLQSQNQHCQDGQIKYKPISEECAVIDSSEDSVPQVNNEQNPTSINQPNCTENQLKLDTQLTNIVQKSVENQTTPQKSTTASKDNNKTNRKYSPEPDLMLPNTSTSIVNRSLETDLRTLENSTDNLMGSKLKLRNRSTKPKKDNERTLDLPDLTPEQEHLVDTTLDSTPAGKVLIEKFKLKICGEDVNTLSEHNWLNDKIIDFYMNLIMQRSEERKDLPQVYATNTLFYTTLKNHGHARLARWTKKVDIFAYDLIVIPVHLRNHWCVSFINFRARKIDYLDSHGKSNQKCLDALLQYLKDEHQDKKMVPFDDSGWEMECLKDIPQQTNSCDCGMFACTFAEFSSRNAPYTFTQAHMPYLRRKAALEILTGKLLL